MAPLPSGAGAALDPTWVGPEGSLWGRTPQAHLEKAGSDPFGPNAYGSSEKNGTCVLRGRGGRTETLRASRTKTSLRGIATKLVQGPSLWKEHEGKGAPPARRNEAADLIRSLPRSWWPRGPLDALPAPPAAAEEVVSVPRPRNARRSPWSEGDPGCRCCAGAGSARIPEERVPATPPPLPGSRTRPGRSRAPPRRATPGPASPPRAPQLLNHL